MVDRNLMHGVTSRTVFGWECALSHTAPFASRVQSWQLNPEISVPLSFLRPGALVLVASTLAACSDSAVVDAGDRARLELSATVDRAQGGATRSDNLPSPAATAAGLVIASGRDTILITRAQLVLREIELELADDRSCSAIARPGDDDDDCGEIERGPVLFDLPLTGATASRLAVDVPAGRYDELEVKIHKVEGGDADDRAFLQRFPDFRGVSARLEGRYNGQSFTFLTDVNGKVELEFRPPLEVGPQGMNVTLAIDLARWFARGGATAGLYSPALANVPGEARSRVEGNIRASFRALRDRNRDGRDD
jgi:hypothetical protein